MNRLRGIGTKAAGGVGGQASQALASFVLQIVAARSLGAGGLGLFAMLYGAIVLGTSVSSGLIGDSLTVLDRGDRRVRAALVRWCLLVGVVSGLVAGVVTAGTGVLPVAAAVAFGLATAVYIVEDAARRLLMATLRFWSLPVVDMTSLAGSLVVLGLGYAVHAEFTLGTFMLALLVGQSAALLAAWLRLPSHERPMPLRGDAAMAEIFAFGAWRSLQVSLRPQLLFVTRLVITAAAGVVAYGQIEAGRIYMAPALLAVSGIGSFLMPMYASQRSATLGRLRRRADLAALLLLAGTLAFGVLATLALPWLGGVITGGDYEISPVAVLGWAAYAACSAGLASYTTLTAVRQPRQGYVTAVRILDPATALVLLVPAVLVDPDLAPFALAAGSLLGTVTVRRFGLRDVPHDGTGLPAPDDNDASGPPVPTARKARP